MCEKTVAESCFWHLYTTKSGKRILACSKGCCRRFHTNRLRRPFYILRSSKDDSIFSITEAKAISSNCPIILTADHGLIQRDYEPWAPLLGYDNGLDDLYGLLYIEGDHNTFTANHIVAAKEASDSEASASCFWAQVSALMNTRQRAAE